jgi:hypothetical protein
MPFTEAFIALVPDADAKRDRTVLETDLYKLFVVLVPSEAGAAAVSRALVEDDGVQSINLCPGFTHGDVARVADAVGATVAVSVSRGDSPGSQLVRHGLQQAGWF